MKIYQVHEYGGEWEDRFDHIIKSFLDKKKAENFKQESEIEFDKKLKFVKHCYNCPFSEDSVTEKQLLNYCPRVTRDDFEFNGNEVIKCKKYEFVWEENISYSVEEVEVKE